MNNETIASNCVRSSEEDGPERVEEAASENFRTLPLSPKNHDVLSDRQRAAIELLVVGKSFRDVAEQVHVTPRTVYAWRQDESFRAEVERRRREVWDIAAERLRGLIHPALDVLEEQVHDEYDRARVRAAGMILRLADLRKSVPPRREEE
jgi:hypothetical protein